MKIDNELSNNTTFGSLQPGDVFRYNQAIYMKTFGGEKNAVQLDDGRIANFSSNHTIVKPLPEAKVTLR